MTRNSVCWMCLLAALLAVPLAFSACAKPQPGSAPLVATSAPEQPAPEQMPTARPMSTSTMEPQLPTATRSEEALPDASALSTPVSTIGGQSESLDAETVAIVGDTAISVAAYETRLSQAKTSFLQQPSFDQSSESGKHVLRILETQVLDWMIDQLIIEQAAAARGVQVTDKAIDAQLGNIKGNDQARFETWLAASGLDLTSLREQVRMDLITAAMRDRVTGSLSRRAEQFHTRHMLLSEEGKASEALGLLEQGQAFDSVCRRYSEDEATRESGGDLGFMPRGIMPPSFEAAVFSMKPGDVSEVVRSESGFHIIQLIEVEPERLVPDAYWPAAQQRAFEDWLATERTGLRIQRRPSG